MIASQRKLDIKSEIIIDNFAGVECASTGIEMAHIPPNIFRHVMR